jgi:hypothetical protein
MDTAGDLQREWDDSFGRAEISTDVPLLEARVMPVLKD